MPRIQGGGSSEDLGTSSGIYQNLIQRGVSRQQAAQFVTNVPTYWGNQPILEAPAYVGVVVIFLALLALFFPYELVKEMAVCWNCFFPSTVMGKTLIFSPVYLWIISPCILNLERFLLYKSS